MKMRTSVLGWVLALSSFSTPVFADTYPGDDWESASPESVGIDPVALRSFTEFGLKDDGIQRPDALLVIHQGKIVFEKYAYGYHARMPHLSWSVSKSFTSILMGIADAENVLIRDSKVHDFFPTPSISTWEREARARITLFDLLSMSSGYDFTEDYTAKAPLKSDVIQMLYMNPWKDMAAYVASRPLKTFPGDRYFYSTGDTTLAMGMLKYRLSKEDYDSYPWRKLFNPIGMRNVVWEQDGSGTFMGGSNLYATARDYARFGYLLLKNGKWKDRQIVPEEWIQRVRELSPGIATGSQEPSGRATYGAGFWLNLPAPKWEIPTPFPQAPADTYFALGHNGQSILIVPSKDLVVVRLAHDLDDNALNLNEYFGRIVRAVSYSTDGTPDIETSKSTSIAKTIIPAKGVLPPVYEERQEFPLLFMKLLASVRAKDYCSCRFVVGQSDAFCTDLVKNGFPMIYKSVNEEEKSARFGIGYSRTARYESDTFGCSFIR